MTVSAETIRRGLLALAAILAVLGLSLLPTAGEAAPLAAAAGGQTAFHCEGLPSAASGGILAVGGTAAGHLLGDRQRGSDEHGLHTPGPDAAGHGSSGPDVPGADAAGQHAPGQHAPGQHAPGHASASCCAVGCVSALLPAFPAWDGPAFPRLWAAYPLQNPPSRFREGPFRPPRIAA